VEVQAKQTPVHKAETAPTGVQVTQVRVKFLDDQNRLIMRNAHLCSSRIYLDQRVHVAMLTNTLVAAVCTLAVFTGLDVFKCQHKGSAGKQSYNG